ncbi:SURF1 family protein [Streptomyces sp. NPDC005438]|uniref:SURF1 family protein n=1 Tax=Streptomyces sp. NPDC005438 TaxID=3156880 RepID=UPI0033AADD88
MYRFLLTPRWWGINLFVALSIPFCLLMGTWQLGRFEARVDEQREQGSSSRVHAAARPLGEMLPVSKETNGKPARVTGTYDRERQLLVPDRTVDDREGFYVLTLLRDRAADGRALPVVRGWLPGTPDPDRVPPPPKGTVTVTGALQASESASTPGANAHGGLPRGQLGVISAASLVNLVPYQVHDAWITQQRTTAPMKPVPPARAHNTGLDLKAFQNLGYTAEWFVFAGFVLFMWFRLFRREVEVARDLSLGLHHEPPESAPSEEEPPRAGDTAPAQPSAEEAEHPPAHPPART